MWFGNEKFFQAVFKRLKVFLNTTDLTSLTEQATWQACNQTFFVCHLSFLCQNSKLHHGHVWLCRGSRTSLVDYFLNLRAKFLSLHPTHSHLFATPQNCGRNVSNFMWKKKCLQYIRLLGKSNKEWEKVIKPTVFRGICVESSAALYCKFQCQAVTSLSK